MKLDWRAVGEYYKDLRPRTLRTPKYQHLFLILFWPVFGLVFFSLEKAFPIIWQRITGDPLIYREVVCAWDAYIPFCEWFVIPYYFWFAFMFLTGAYGVLFDVRSFRFFSWLVITTYSVTVLIYLIWPNMQALRPTDIPRDNWMVDIVHGLYNFDTNTNVCPSIHVLGALATCFAGIHGATLRTWGWRCYFIISTVAITLSTVFLKQHSILDIFAALAVFAVCYPLVYFVILRQKTPHGRCKTKEA